MSALRRRRRRLSHFPSLSLRCINSHHGKTHNGVGCFLFPPRLKRYGPQRFGEGSRSRTCLKRKVLFQNYVSLAHFQAVVCCFKRCVFLAQLWFLLWPIPPQPCSSQAGRDGYFYGAGGGSCCRRPIND